MAQDRMAAPGSGVQGRAAEMLEGRCHKGELYQDVLGTLLGKRNPYSEAETGVLSPLGLAAPGGSGTLSVPPRSRHSALSHGTGRRLQRTTLGNFTHPSRVFSVPGTPALGAPEDVAHTICSSLIVKYFRHYKWFWP